MKKALFLASCSLLFAVACPASAQGPTWRPGGSAGGLGQGNNSTLNPAVSPYMNLYRRGSSVAVNYYGLVRPAIDVRGAIQNLQQEVDMPAPGTGGGGFDQLSPLLTGSRARFMNTGNYFLSGAPVGGSRGGMGFGSGGGGGSIVVVSPQQGGSGGGSQNMRMGGSVPTNTSPRR